MPSNESNQEPLTPEDLDIEENESVRKIGESRYVIQTDSTVPDSDSPTKDSRQSSRSEKMPPEKSSKSVEISGKNQSGSESASSSSKCRLTIGGVIDGEPVSYTVEEENSLRALQLLLEWYETTTNGDASKLISHLNKKKK